jgi:hypothetical protein
MSDNQRESRAKDQAPSASTAEAPTPEVAVEPVARLLANPRRTRRD